MHHDDFLSNLSESEPKRVEDIEFSLCLGNLKLFFDPFKLEVKLYLSLTYFVIKSGFEPLRTDKHGLLGLIKMRSR